MNKKLIYFFIGTVLFFISLPISTKMIMEIIHNQKMNEEYKITNLNEGYPPTDSTYNFNDHTIEIEEKIKNEGGYIDPRNNRIAIADLNLIIDGKEIDTLEDYPLRVEAEGLNRYHGDIAYLKVEDLKNEKTQFIVLLKKTKLITQEEQHESLMVSLENLDYSLYAIDEHGVLDQESFNATERDALQTELLNAGVLVPYAIGYHTNALQEYPSLFFPILYPFATLVIGLIFMIFFFPLRRERG
ncbi:hypothetical protein ACQCU1_12715 [Sutcliffiella horikoshii]|uniref:hypothetical protein n=1 Tax=Sutcliffiella horikoshii TaxID=79883 RepID=UPI003CF34ED9